MDHLDLARWQFAITTIYHFLFVPLSIGLVFLIAVMHTLYVVKKEDVYKRMAQFWGKLFLLNFAVGVVTGIMQEFQFGMNWSDYSRFVGDVFGGPLAVEALVSFFLESTFLGVWIFGWERLPKKVHLASIWLVAAGTTMSAFWILTANSFMQEPVGFAIRDGHAEMVSFGALLSNPQLWLEFPHVVFGALATGALFMTGVSAYKLLRKQQLDIFKPSFSIAIVVALISSILVAIVGHDQAQHLVQSQPMKMAASEGLWETSGDSAPWTVIAGIDVSGQKNDFSLEIPGLLSVLSYNKLTGQVQGIKDLQAQYEAQYGPGNYIPPVRTTFWSFRIMVLAGGLMVLLGLYGTIAVMRKRLERQKRYLRWMVPAIGLPFIANTAGWIMTEIGRQPWIVFGLQKTEDGVSPTVSSAMVLTSLIGFTLVYGILAAVLIYLFVRTIRQGADEEGVHPADEENAKQAHEGALAETEQPLPAGTF
ncbi:cytochrome ubiquinol oxidase subunit I [Paenibacillus beijingensis]|uniref:Cytochrome D ubiquinol oxidase subunit I n=1 Tax=Paenibacillus beijingensis TaxID=1126833 RepID=A0A0D5NKG3_9BACL|nr:cytochrome ubiquinol oxidase subunit I [Paenibacillus beijingensis]AJY75502.1 cytochrome D ubiquinol oxidase subunit I [Paenibacillus beijingensis]